MQMENIQEVAPVNDRVLLTSLGTSIAVWAIHFMMMYALVALACGRGWLNYQILGLPGLNFVLTVITIAALILIGVAGLSAYQSWQKLRHNAVVTDAIVVNEGRYDRDVFLSFSGVVFSVLFGVLVILSLIPSFIVPQCQ